MRIILLLLLTIHHCWSKCDDGWTRFERESGGWCVKLFYKYLTNQTVAESLCKAEGATLSGLQNMLEVIHVTAEAAEHLHPATGSIWIGLNRKEECLYKGIEGDCGKYSSFEWTDGVTTGDMGMAWDCGQPNNWEHSQHCVGLLASRQSYVVNDMTGKINDIDCQQDIPDIIGGEEYAIKGHLCGKKEVV